MRVRRGRSPLKSTSKGDGQKNDLSNTPSRGVGGSASQQDHESKSPGTPSKGSKIHNSPSQTQTNVYSSATKHMACPEILRIEELLDLPIPIFTKGRPDLSMFGTDRISSEDFNFAFGDNSSRSSMKRNTEEDGSLGKRNPERVTFDDITDGLKKKLLSWGQLVFNRRTYEYLRERSYILEEY